MADIHAWRSAISRALQPRICVPPEPSTGEPIEDAFHDYNHMISVISRDLDVAAGIIDLLNTFSKWSPSERDLSRTCKTVLSWNPCDAKTDQEKQRERNT